MCCSTLVTSSSSLSPEMSVPQGQCRTWVMWGLSHRWGRTGAATGRPSVSRAAQPYCGHTTRAPRPRSPAEHMSVGSPRPAVRPRLTRMCRNIRTLYNFEPPATQDEVRDAATQYVRKSSGLNKPSRANAEALERARAGVAEAASRLLGEL